MELLIKHWDGVKKYITKPSWQLLIFGIIHFFIFFFWFQSPLYGKMIPGFSGFLVFWDYSSKVIQGLLPYRDFLTEYPLLGVVVITLPRIITSNPDTYYGAFVAEMFLFNLAGLLIIASLSKQLGLHLLQVLILYTLSLLALGRIITIRFDIVPAVLTTLAIYTFIRAKYKLAWAFIAIGAFIKIYPIIIIPIFLLYHIVNRSYRQLVAGILTFLFTSVLAIVPSLLISPSGILQPLTYQSGRPLQLESTYASLLLVCQNLGLTSLIHVSSFGSENVVSTVANLFARISPLIIILSLLTVYWLFYKELRQTDTGKRLGPSNSLDGAIVVKYSLLAILALILTDKVLSTQYIIWLYPLIPFIVGRYKVVAWVIFFVAGILSYFVYPIFYSALVTGASGWAVGVLFTRNILLIALGFLVALKSNQLALKQTEENNVICN
jgi:uncharacterized membrane protein